ncbi:protein of unknown function [Cupriavidus neocaledonicus]|uniref:Uncharacterized protein n=1 Tax=Cupriavidus neocaledonicus TaxID=1040979 RepID=A0A375H422_9BURK|nr:protein of unknown function [Cupriavidus neocaledonicus]
MCIERSQRLRVLIEEGDNVLCCQCSNPWDLSPPAAATSVAERD